MAAHSPNPEESGVAAPSSRAVLERLRAECGELRELMQDAVRWIRESEELTGVGVPKARRQLHQASEAVVFALADFDGETPPDLSAARTRAAQARSVAVAAVISAVSDESRVLRNRIGKALLLRHFPDYGKFFSQIDTAAALGKQSPRSPESEAAMLEWAQTKWPEIREMYQSLRSSEPALLDAKRAEDDAKLENNHRFRAMRILAVLGVLVGIAGVAVAVAVALLF